MFSDHVHTDVLEDLEIVDHRFVRRGSVQSIRPVSLATPLALNSYGPLPHEIQDQW
jgi:hypothetical protein